MSSMLILVLNYQAPSEQPRDSQKPVLPGADHATLSAAVRGDKTITAARAPICRDSFSRQLEVAHNYTRFKLGDRGEVVRATADIFKSLAPEVCHGVATHPEDWSVLSIGTHRGFGLPSGAILLAQECALRLGIPHVTVPVMGSNRQNASARRYEELAGKNERVHLLRNELQGATLPVLHDKHVVLIDDVIASGAFIEVMLDIARQQGAQTVHPHVLHHLEAGGDYSFEHTVNRSGAIHDPVSLFSELLRDEQTAFTTRLVSYCLALPAETLRAVLVQVTPSARLNLLAASLVYYGDNLPGAFITIATDFEPSSMNDVWCASPQSQKCIERLGHFLQSRKWQNQPLSPQTFARILATD